MGSWGRAGWAVGVVVVVVVVVVVKAVVADVVKVVSTGRWEGQRPGSQAQSLGRERGAMGAGFKSETSADAGWGWSTTRRRAGMNARGSPRAGPPICIFAPLGPIRAVGH